MMFAWFAWVIFSTIRRYKIAKLQAYAQTEAGREMLESLKVERHSPHARIIGALQTSIILISLGAGFLFLRGRISGAEAGFLLLGTLSTMLGIGFALSAVASYYMSKS